MFALKVIFAILLCLPFVYLLLVLFERLMEAILHSRNE